MDMEGLKIIGTSIVTFMALYFTFQKNDKDKLNDKIDKKADEQDILAYKKEMKEEITRLHDRIDKKADESAMLRIENKIEAIYNRLINGK